MNITNKKIKLYEYFISTNNYRDLMRYAFEIFENPMFIFDPSFSITVSCVDSKGNEYINVKATNDINSSFLLEKISDIKNDEIAIIKGLKYPIMVKAICNGENILGYTSLMAKNRPFNKEDEELLKIASNICAKNLSISNFNNGLGNLFYISLLDGFFKDSREIDNVLHSMGIKNDKYRLGLIRTNNQKKVFARLLKVHKDGAVFLYKKDILVIFSSLSVDKDMIANIMRNFNEGKDEALLGISDIYSNLQTLKKAYDEINELIDLATLLDKDKIVYYYEEYSILLMLKEIDKNKLDSLIDVRAKKIMLFDKENNTTYFDDLYNYFKANRNINKVSEIMHVHKNSIYYKVKKIQELFNIDLDNDVDCFSLELSLRIMRLLEKIT